MTLAPDASLTDHGFEPLSIKGLTYPLGSFGPEFGDVHEIAPGVGWTRLPVPGTLKHINVWLLDDGDGVAVVDTGLRGPETQEAWTRALGGRRVTRVFVTHFHPDHVGSAGWLCEAHDARLWMSRGEWLFARFLSADAQDQPPREAIAQWTGAGWSQAQIDTARASGWGFFSRVVSPFPAGYIRLQDGQSIAIGSRTWTVRVGSGHSPEHACLVDEVGGLMIAGDQVLPRITSNISMSIMEPQADPLGEWLASIARFRATLSNDLLVLPAHGEPFYGLQARLERLAEGHEISLDRLAALLAEGSRRAIDCFGSLFAREIDETILGLATGEALAHLRHLEVTGRAVRETRDGVWYFKAA